MQRGFARSQWLRLTHCLRLERGARSRLSHAITVATEHDAAARRYPGSMLGIMWFFVVILLAPATMLVQVAYLPAGVALLAPESADQLVGELTALASVVVLVSPVAGAAVDRSRDFRPLLLLCNFLGIAGVMIQQVAVVQGSISLYSAGVLVGSMGFSVGFQLGYTPSLSPCHLCACRRSTATLPQVQCCRRGHE